MYMKNVETLDTIMGHHCAAASITTKKEPQGWSLGKCVQMYKSIFAWGPQFTKSAPDRQHAHVKCMKALFV